MKQIKINCKLVSEIFDLAVLLYDEDGSLLADFNSELTYNPLHSYINNLEKKRIETLNKHFPYPRVRKNNLFDRYILLSIIKEDCFKGTVVVGPSVPNKISEAQLLVLMKEYNAFSDREAVMSYYSKLPTYTTDKLFSISIFLHKIFNNKFVSYNRIKKDYFDSHTIHETIKEEKLPHHTHVHTPHERLFEQQVLKIVRNGEVENLEKGLFIKDEEAQALYSKSSYLRSLKNHIITLVALVSRTAIEGGLHSEIALENCDRFILLLEEASSVDDLYKLSTEMLSFYTHKVRDAKTKKYSYYINEAIHYIYSNLYTEFQQQDVANYVSVTPNYLSSLFKKETNNTLSHFIQKTRIDEAKLLLTTTNSPVLDIGVYLTFTDQSYFTKIFKKHVGLTPLQYRQKKTSID